MIRRIFLAACLGLFPALAFAQAPSMPPVVAVATGTTGAVVATMSAQAGKTNWICGLDVSATGGTATNGPVVVAGTLTGSLTYQLSANVANQAVNFNRTYTPCIPASAPNTAITVTTTAAAGATAVDVQAWGFTTY